MPKGKKRVKTPAQRAKARRRRGKAKRRFKSFLKGTGKVLKTGGKVAGVLAGLAALAALSKGGRRGVNRSGTWAPGNRMIAPVYRDVD